MKRELAEATLDTAFTSHISQVFGMLCSSTEVNAFDRLCKEWARAEELHDQMMAKVLPK